MDEMRVLAKLSSSPVEGGWLEDQSKGRTSSRGSGTSVGSRSRWLRQGW